MCYFSGESIHEDPVLFLEKFHRSATTRNSLSDKLKYQLLDHHLKGEVLDWFRKEGKKDLPFDDGTLNCFVQRFLSRFLTEERRNQMQEDFYMRTQGENKPGEAYIHAKNQLWRRLQLDQQDVTNPDLSTKHCGLRQHNEFFLKLTKPKTIEELRETVHLADQCKTNPSSAPGVVQANIHENPQDKRVEQQVQIVHNTQRQHHQAWGKRIDKLMQQMENLAIMQQKVLEKVADKPKSSSRASSGSYKPVCFNCHKQRHYMDQCRAECGGCGASGHAISHCNANKSQPSNVYNPSTQRELVSEASEKNGDMGAEQEDFRQGGHKQEWSPMTTQSL